jgi:site-specific recombinase XerD
VIDRGGGTGARQSILKWHLVPTLGPKRLDAITNEQVQRLKLALAERAPKRLHKSHLAMKGASARAIQELAGHADLSTT